MRTGETHVFVPDIHANLEMLKRILVASGAATLTPSGNVAKITAGFRLTMLGDLTDRGEENEGVLSLAAQLQDGGQTTIIVGNHDIALDAAMREPTAAHVARWCKMGGTRFLKEIAITHDFRQGGPAAANEPAPGMAAHVGIEKWEQLLYKGGVDTEDMEQACAYLQDTYMSRMRRLFQQTEILTRPLPGVLAIHAGVGPRMQSMHTLQNAQAAWRGFRENGPTGSIHADADGKKSIMAFSEAVWMRRDIGTDRLLGRVACTMLDNEGVSLVIRGHDVNVFRMPTVFEEHRKIATIDTDGGTNSDCYVKILPDNTVLAGSALEGESILGVMHKGLFKAA